MQMVTFLWPGSVHMNPNSFRLFAQINYQRELATVKNVPTAAHQICHVRKQKTVTATAFSAGFGFSCGPVHCLWFEHGRSVEKEPIWITCRNVYTVLSSVTQWREC